MRGNMWGLVLVGFVLSAACTSARCMTICDIAREDKSLAGERVRLSALYYTDFHHGAWLQDSSCPKKSILLGLDSTEDLDPSVERFEAVLAEGRKYYQKHFGFSVEVTGTLVWRDPIVVNANLSPERQLTIPGQLVLSLERVWAFQAPAKRSRR